MITEIFGALIFLGVVLVIVMRWLLHRGKGKAQESVEVSANRLRYEIERSGDAVIGRMQIHVERLERLLAEVNVQKAALDERLAALAEWEKVYGAQLGVLPQHMSLAKAQPTQNTVVPVKAAPPPTNTQQVTSMKAQQPVQSVAHSRTEDGTSFQAALMEQMAGIAVGSSINLQLTPEKGMQEATAYEHQMTNVKARQSEKIQVASMSTSVKMDVAADEEITGEGYDYAEDVAYAGDELGTEDMVEKETVDEYVGKEDLFEEDVLHSPDKEEIEEARAVSADLLLNRQQEQIRAFLRQGLSVEEISQRLGVGVSAVELMRHMEKRLQAVKDKANPSK